MNVSTIRCLCAVFLLVFGADAVNKDALCRFEQLAMGSGNAFNGTPIGYQRTDNSLLHIYWAWYVDPTEGLMHLAIWNRGFQQAFRMPSAYNVATELKNNVQLRSPVVANILYCTGDDYRMGQDKVIKLRWVPYGTKLDLRYCIGAEHEGQAMYVARYVCSPDDVGPFIFRPYDGVAIGQCGGRLRITTSFEILCAVYNVFAP